jgi:hypothetical protein
MILETMTDSDKASLLEGLRAKRKAESTDIAIAMGLALASHLDAIGMNREAGEVEAIVSRVMAGAA